MKRAIGVMAAAMVLSTWSRDARAARVVAVKSSLKVLAPADIPPDASGTIALTAARNEYEPFQVVIDAQNTTLNGIAVQKPDLVLQGTSIHFPATDVRLYLERTIRLTNKSGPDVAGRDPSPEAPVAWPDALVPDREDAIAACPPNTAACGNGTANWAEASTSEQRQFVSNLTVGASSVAVIFVDLFVR